MLHGLGNVKESQALLLPEGPEKDHLMSESFQYHRNALTQLESTLGPYHQRVADVSHRLAMHFIRRCEHPVAQ